jgi:UDP-glucose 4-epimerase
LKTSTIGTAINKKAGLPPEFIKVNIRDSAVLGGIFKQHPITAIIHFAGLKAVCESVTKPLDYYDNNVIFLGVV